MIRIFLVCLLILCLIVVLNKVVPKESYENDDLDENKWDTLPEKLKQVSLSGRSVCGITEDDRIRCSINGKKWEEKEGRLKYLSLSGKRICGVNGNNDIYCAENISNPKWKHVPGKLKQIDLSGNKMCGTGYVDDIYCADFMKDNWKRLDGALKQLAISGKQMCGVTSQNDVYCTDSLVKVQWKHIPGKLSQIDLGDQKMCGVGLNNEVFCADYAKDNWVRKTGNVKFISIDNNQSYSIAPNNDLLYTFDLEGMDYVEPPTYKEPDPLKLTDMLTKNAQEEIKLVDDKTCPYGETQKYDIIKNYMLVKDPKDSRQCYIKDTSLVFDGECSLSNRTLYEPRKDKAVIDNIFTQTITDDYVSQNIPRNVCTIRFKPDPPEKPLNAYLAKLDANVPKVKEVGLELEEVKNYSAVLTDEKSVKENDVQNAEKLLNDKKTDLQQRRTTLDEQRKRISENEQKSAALERELNELKRSLRFL